MKFALHAAAQARRAEEPGSIPAAYGIDTQRESANAGAFADPEAAAIESWGRQATFASGFGGGLAELDPTAAPARCPQPRSAARSTASAGVVELASVFLSALADPLGTAWRKFQATRRTREVARELRHLGDRQLRDIGLDRSQVFSAAAEREAIVFDCSYRLPSYRLI